MEKAGAQRTHVTQIEKAALSRIVEALDRNVPARAVELNDDERTLVRGLQLLTMKPMIYAANVNEADLADQGAGNVHVQALREKAAQENCEVIIVSAQVSLPGMHASSNYLMNLSLFDKGKQWRK